MHAVHPPKLNKGDLIGIVTPASPVADATRIEKGVRYLESLGYRIKVGENVGKVRGYLAGTDEERVADLHAMFADKEVRAIICVRGGYGTPRLLPLLNYRLIARNPKILSGFSDITALQFALWKKCGLITFHGPMTGVEMATEIDPYTEEMFWRALTSTKKIGKIKFPEVPEVQPLHTGKARGRLLGGNLSLIVSILGTPYQPSFRDSLLFVEEIDEQPYRVDRMMMQIRNALLFGGIKGMLLGQFTDCAADPSKPSLTLEDIFRDVVQTFAKPILSNLPFGHVSKKMTVPFGLLARMDAAKHSLEFLEAAVQ